MSNRPIRSQAGDSGTTWAQALVLLGGRVLRRPHLEKETSAMAVAGPISFAIEGECRERAQG